MTHDQRKASVDVWYLATSIDMKIIVGKQIRNHWQVAVCVFLTLLVVYIVWIRADDIR